MGKKPILTVKQVDKSFGPTHALDHVDLEVFRGEIRGLIGENGSGKSTLCSIIAGVQPMDSGEMFIEGEPFAPRSMLEAQKRNISMIVQEMGTVPGITVAANIFIGKEDMFTRLGLINVQKMNAEAKKILDAIGAGDIRPEAAITSLNYEDRKIVEIARAMYNEPEILIVDETTTALSQHGRDILYKVMNDLRDRDKAVIFISHDLDELISVCSTITVLRDGQMIGSLDEGEMDIDVMRSMMIGRELTGSYYRSDADGSHGEKVLLDIEYLTTGPVLENFCCQLHEGEILGIAGLSECGMHELGRAAFGFDKPVTGEIRLRGRKVESTKAAVKMKVGYVSKDRDKEAIIISASILDNIALPSTSMLSRFGIISPKKERAITQKQVELLRIKCSSINQMVKSLSGGNKQKVVFGKWLGNQSDVFILDCPTRGIDVGVKSAMYDLMYELKKQGKGILLISEEMSELIGMSDRILVLKNGRQTAELIRGPEMAEENIIKYMI